MTWHNVIYFNFQNHFSMKKYDMASGDVAYLLEYLSDRVREAKDRMKRIADRVCKVSRSLDEADSRSDIQSR
jgi:hypothetical protein